MYVATGTLVLMAAAYRYWVSKRRRPTFATSLPEAAGRPAARTTPAASGPPAAHRPASRRPLPPTLGGHAHEAATSPRPRPAPHVRHRRGRRQPRRRGGHGPRRRPRWTASAAPLEAPPISASDIAARLSDASARSAALEQQIVDLTTQTDDLSHGPGERRRSGSAPTRRRPRHCAPSSRRPRRSSRHCRRPSRRRRRRRSRRRPDPAATPSPRRRPTPTHHEDDD